MISVFISDHLELQLNISRLAKRTGSIEARVDALMLPSLQLSSGR
jgi:hypothetical protein